MDEGQPIMGYGYPFFEWSSGIEINESMEDYEEENIMIGEEIPIQHKENLVNTEIEEGGESNDYVDEENIIGDEKLGMRDSYVTEEDESDENKEQ